jgi:hypothetical protein
MKGTPKLGQRVAYTAPHSAPFGVEGQRIVGTITWVNFDDAWFATVKVDAIPENWPYPHSESSRRISRT